MTIDELISFCRLILQFRSVERRVQLPSSSQNENDVEHSYMLAMTAWYIASTHTELKLNVDLVIKYALAHDMVEVYAGDTYIYDEQKVANKVMREHRAFEALKQNYPDFHEIHELIEAYERQSDPESRFVYALDKVIPMIVIFIGGGKSWHRDGITLEMLDDHKNDKVKASAVIADLYEQLRLKLLEHPDYFPGLAKRSS